MSCNSTIANLPSAAWSTSLGILMCMVTLAATLENLGILIIIWRYKVLRTQSNKILSSLAVADMLTGCTVAPLHAAQYLNENILHNCIVDDIRRFLSTFLLVASTCALGFVSFDRCMHLVRLRNHKIKDLHLNMTIFICYLLPIIIICCRYIPSDVERVYSGLIVALGTVILTSIIVSYAALLFALYNYSKKSSIRRQSEENKKRAVVTIIIIITFFFLMIVPLGVYHGMSSTRQMDQFESAKVYCLTMFLAIANSAVNPLIYCYRTNILKRYIHIFFQDLVQSQREEESVQTSQQSQL